MHTILYSRDLCNFVKVETIHHDGYETRCETVVTFVFRDGIPKSVDGEHIVDMYDHRIGESPVDVHVRFVKKYGG